MYRYFLILFLLTGIPQTATAEPHFQDLLNRALITLELHGDLDKWTKSLRSAAWLPTLKLHGKFRQKETLDTLEKSNFFRDDQGSLLHEWTQAQTRGKHGGDWEVSVQMQWSLKEIIFNPDVLDAESRAAKRRQQKLAFIDHLAGSFSKWKILHGKKIRVDKEKEELFYLENYFNGLTEGWFSKELN